MGLRLCWPLVAIFQIVGDDLFFNRCQTQVLMKLKTETFVTLMSHSSTEEIEDMDFS